MPTPVRGQKTGIPTLYNMAKASCTALAKFAPIIQKLYGDNAALMAALAASQAACSVLALELGKVRDWGD